MASICVTTDSCKNWEKTGKSDFIRICKNFILGEKDHIIAKNQSKVDLKRALYEICWHVVRNNLKEEQAVIALGELVVIHHDVPSILTDILTIIDAETQCMDEKIIRNNFISLIGALNSIVPDRLMKERIDVDTLSAASIINNRKNFNTKFIKVKTKLFYKQQKFNLLREESEGYAKLMAELNQEIVGTVTAEYLLEVIKSLIGYFNLDPNRVLDIILESFENRPELHEFFIPLLKSYMCDQNTLCEVIGFKYTFYQATADSETPKSLYIITALMLQHELIPLDSIYVHLKLKDSEIIEQHKKELQEARLYARKLNTSTIGQEKSDNADKDSPIFYRYSQNQKLGLCEALLNVGDWEHAFTIINRLPTYYATSHKPICEALCSLIHCVIDPLYKRYSGLTKLIKGKPVMKLDSKLAVKKVENFSDLKATVFHMLYSLGPQLYTDPLLMVKVLRLAKSYFAQKLNSTALTEQGNHSKDGLEFDFLTILDEVLLPSLSLLECNCCMAEELWSLVKLYPYQHRYRLYGQWKNETYQHHPRLIRARADSIKKIKYIMKRLSKENVKPSGRHIGKLSHSSPGFLFEYILSQIQTWNNLIGPVVDSLKYLTNLSYDVLAYCIIEALANPEKDRMKHDGTTISLWLQSLSNFCGAIFKKYSIELTGLLQYVANQLKAEKSLDLLILKEIVQKMAGIEALEEMTNDQLDAMAGGELLRAEGGYFSQIRNTKKSSQRLKEALIEQDLAIPLCLLVAQQRNCVIYKEQENSHLKLVGKLYDQCQDTLVQFGSFLASNLSMEDYVKQLPPIAPLMSEYHIMSDVAFFLSRPLYSHAIASKFDELRKQDKSSKSSSSGQVKHQKYLEIVETIMNPIIESVIPLHPPKVWEDISPQFYVTFWTLTMYDLRVPTSMYEKEFNKLKSQMLQIEDNKDMVQSKKKKEIERCKALMEKMQDEEKKQKEHCDRVLTRLKNEKDTWFLSRSAKNETITQFLQLCVFPRCIFTSMDAIYCAKFVHTIHDLKTPNFSTLICYDRIFCDITYTVTSCTENEANRYGRFLSAMLETVMRWHSNKSIFEKECANYPGFVTKFRVAKQTAESANDHVDYENYRHVCHKWHFKITKAFLICLESGDFVQIRNSLIVLTKILQHYPVIINLYNAIETRINNLQSKEKDTRPDLYALAVGYLGQLKTKKSSMTPEHEFHLKETEEGKFHSSNGMKNDSSSRTHSKPKDNTSNSISEGRIERNKDSQSKENREKERKPGVTIKQEKLDSKVFIGKVSGASKNNSSNNVNSGLTNLKRDTLGMKLDKDSDRDKGVAHSHERNFEKMKSRESKEDKNSFSSSKDERSHSFKDEKNSKEDKIRPDKIQITKDFSRDDNKEKTYHKDDKEEKRHYKEDISDKAERASSISSGSSSHSQRRSVDPTESERDIKRRKLEHPVPSGKKDVLLLLANSTTFAIMKNSRHEEKIKDTEKEKSKERDREKKREKSRSREPEREIKLKEREKEKKAERKRERLEDKELSSSSDLKKRKDEDSVKLSRQNGETEVKEKEYHRREGSGDKERSRERKVDIKEDKKQGAQVVEIFPPRRKDRRNFKSSAH